MFRSPKFWNDKNSKFVKLLRPIAKGYAFVSSISKNSVVPEKTEVPVICVGNVVTGGAGKTPTVELICNMLKESSHTPHILTSGYGGYLKNVVKVDSALHSYLQVGDEALLSATVAPTWVGKNRVNSAKAAILTGSDVLVMDDGLQNNSIQKDLKILVVDSGQGFGNEELFPAGPLRESVNSGLKKSDVVMIIGEENTELENKIKGYKKDIAIYYAKMKVIDHLDIENNKVIGFCGLGYPEKFRKTLIAEKLEIVDFIAFPDHHPYTITEIQKLIKAAKNADAKLVTTMKDYVKVPDIFKNEMLTVRVQLKLQDETFADLLDKILKTYSKENA
ncbi:MAG: tetraacyldisaccharide 4'-kinase [Holosporales bacterium]|nr:tetraacyldisaccharide 4'-kinase [Holosporales bacterium]